MSLDDTYDQAKELYNSAVDDVEHEIQLFKGGLQETLGGVPFKAAVFFLVLYSFLYTSYAAFFGSRIGDEDRLESECYCSSGDRQFYRSITLGFPIAWLIFLLFYALLTIGNGTHFTCHHHGFKEFLKHYQQTKDYIKNREEDLQDRLIELVNGSYLNIEHYLTRKKTLEVEGETRVKSKAIQTDLCTGTHDSLNDQCSTQGSEATVQNNNGKDNTSTEHLQATDSTRKAVWRCPIICSHSTKFALIFFRFIFRLLIVPLMLLQLVNDYTWSCVMNGILRDYCSSTTNEYFLALDHSLVLYCLYVCVIIALLLTYLITWLPKGTPWVIIQYDDSENNKFFDQFDVKYFKKKRIRPMHKNRHN